MTRTKEKLDVRTEQFGLKNSYPRVRGSSKGSCLVTFEEEIEGLMQKGIRRDYCAMIQPEKDRIQFSLRPGLFGWSWVDDIVILRGP